MQDGMTDCSGLPGVPLPLTDHGRERQTYEGLADLFGVHLPSRDAVYLVPIAAVPGHVGRLRLEPAKNNQRRGVRFAADFEVDRWTHDRLAGLATAARASAA
jgi:hypothetical protein